jgi:LPS sulfotransferase NodH
MKTIQKIRFQLKNLALDLGIQSGYSDYDRFIILARGRTGSNYLRGLLNAHSQIIAFGELFRFYDSIGWDLPPYDEYLKSPDLISLMQRDPIQFLEKKVFRKFPKQIAAVGFKMFYYHAQNDSRKPVWAFLKDQKNLKVIHLKRNNTLRVVISEMKAMKTNQWTNTTGIEEDNFVTSLDYEECLQWFTRTHEFKKQYDIFFKDHPKIDVSYENLSRNYENEVKRIQEFLGVNYESVKPSTYKQSSQPLSKAISNYVELKEQFKNTPWEEFFEE